MWTILTLVLLDGCAPGDALQVSRLVAPTEVRVDDLAYGETGAFSVIVHNNGTAPTVFSASVSAPFNLTIEDDRISPGSQESIDIRFWPDSYQETLGELTVEGDDNDLSVLLRVRVATDLDLDGYEALEVGGTDCDDADFDIYPGADEVCDGVDQDCDGLIDEDALDARSWYLDEDGDGWGGSEDTLVQCEQPEGHVLDGGDCDDQDPSIHPTAEDPCYDGIDQDCDRWDDYDCDHDSWVADTFGGEDCDDQRADVHPGATEVWYDGIDQDCDGSSDFDQDRDGWLAPGGGGSDCDDLDAAIYPGAVELDDGRDQDCDGRLDEDFVLDGDLLICEIMLDPTALDDDKGQYVEVTNLSARDIYLDGLEVRSDAGASILGSGLLEPDQSTLVCASTDPSRNGSMSCAGALPGLLGSSDGVFIRLEQPLDHVQWSGWDIPDGASWELPLSSSMSSEDNDDASSWCESTQVMSTGDLGSPGDASTHCQ